MSAENKIGTWGVVASLITVGLIAFLFGRSRLNGDSRLTTYQVPASPAVPSAPRFESAQSLAALAESHFSARRYNEAIEIYRKILAHDPNDANVYNDLGLALHYSGKSDAAVDALKKATTLDPKLQRAWLSYGFVLKSMGRETPALAALKKTVALNPSTPQGLEALSMLKR